MQSALSDRVAAGTPGMTMPGRFMRMMAVDPLMRRSYGNQAGIRGSSHREGAAQDGDSDE
jgi:hypothetical protein